MLIKTDCWQMNVADDIEPARLIYLKLRRDPRNKTSVVYEPKNYYDLVRKQAADIQEQLNILVQKQREERTFPLRILNLRVQMLRAKLAESSSGRYDKAKYKTVEDLCRESGPMHRDIRKRMRQQIATMKKLLACYQAELDCEGR